MWPWLLLVVGVLSLWATFTALVRVRRPAAFGFLILATSWTSGEYPVFQIVAQAAVVGAFGALGGFERTAGVIGAVLAATSWVLLIVVRVRQREARPTADAALRAGLGDDYLDRLDDERRAGLRTRPELGLLLRPLHHDTTGIERIADLAYGDHSKRNLLDVYRPTDPPDGALPVVIQIHGGGWVIGHKRQQGMPLVHRLAANGYVAVSINYRLAPRTRFPDQLVDVKRAIAWTRRHIAEYGGDPDTIILTGGSAGGHLAALAALTPNVPAYQPGFEHEDTSVSACMPFYGPTDFTDADGIRGRVDAFEVFLKRTAMPGGLADVPELYAAMSPITHVRADAVPFFIIQGTIDVLVWREENRAFADRLAAVSNSPVVYWEVPGAQHAFDTFHSRRCSVAVDACERFAGWVTATTRTNAVER